MAEEQPKPEEKNDNFNYIVRIANADLDGKKSVYYAMKKIKGISYALSGAACRLAGVDLNKKTGYLEDSEIKKLTEVIENPGKFGVPIWAFNRRKDPETGEDKHLLGGDLQFTQENDVKMMKKMKSYRGMRHAAGLPTRGQRTKSNFRKSKSRGKGSLGVAKKSKKSGK